MLSAGFLRQQWPKWHEHVVEECDVLHINDVLGRIDRELLATRWEWTLAGPLPLRLVARLGGPFKRWWIACPRCGRRRDALYLPPNAPRWACRECHELIYATQRHGYRHPLRKVLTYRKRVTLRREVSRQQRRWERVAGRREPGILDPETAAAIEWAQRLHAALAARRVSRETEAAMVRDREEASPDDVGARFAALTERALVRMRQLAESDSKRVRDGANRALVRYERRLGAQLDAQRRRNR